jgi:hypothetical protein
MSFVDFKVEREKKNITTRIMQLKKAIALGQKANPSGNLKNVKEQEADIDEIIRTLRITYESDNEIKIQVPNKKAKNEACDILGFRDNQTLTWKTLLEILEVPDHIYDVGPAHIFSSGLKLRRSDYDKRVKCLKRISDKLINYLRKSHSLKIPDNYKLFEPAKSLGKGIFKPVFKVGLTRKFDNITSLEIKYDRYPKERLIREAEKLADEKRKGTSDGFDKLATVGKMLLEKGWMESDKLEKLINPSVNKEFIRKETSKEIFKPDE